MGRLPERRAWGQALVLHLFGHGGVSRGLRERSHHEGNSCRCLSRLLLATHPRRRNPLESWESVEPPQPMEPLESVDPPGRTMRRNLLCRRGPRRRRDPRVYCRAWSRATGPVEPPKPMESPEAIGALQAMGRRTFVSRCNPWSHRSPRSRRSPFAGIHGAAVAGVHGAAAAHDIVGIRRAVAAAGVAGAREAVRDTRVDVAHGIAGAKWFAGTHGVAAAHGVAGAHAAAVGHWPNGAHGVAAAHGSTGPRRQKQGPHVACMCPPCSRPSHGSGPT